MIIIKVEGKNIEKALRKYKIKHRNVGISNELRERKYFTKYSEIERGEKNKAIYLESKNLED